MRVRVLLFSLLFAIAGCATTRQAPVEAPAVSFTVVSDSIPGDPEMEALVAPYRDRLQAAVSEVIGEATGPLEKGQPESPLGNFAADALIYAAEEMIGEDVDFAVTNYGGLRIPSIAAGAITVGRIYELMPFENTVVVITLTGVEVDTLAQQIARVGGEPVSLLAFDVTRAGQAENIRVGEEPLDHNRTYRLATINYLADGGGTMPVLAAYSDRTDPNLLFRDALIAYVRHRQRIDPLMQERIRRIGGPEE